MMQRKFISSTNLILAAVLSIAVIILVNTLFTSLRLDLTENKLFTLSKGTVNILKSLDEPISLDFYFSRKSMVDYPQLINYANRVRDLLEEYAATADGKIKLTVIEPEPFSEEEDRAVASGLQGVAVNAAGDRAYFGLVGTNSTDDEKTIPFFRNDRETALEYDITKLIYNLAYPDKRTVGVISSLPLFGDAQGATPWAIIDAMREFVDVEDLGTDVDSIKDIDVLLVVHPKDLKPKTMFAIDQYLLAGGKAILFVDPFAEADNMQPPAGQPVLPDMDSDMKFLFDGWGIEIPDQKIVGDINAAMRVQTRGARGPQEADYLPWLRLGPDNLNQDDFATSELKVINMGTAGVIEKKEDSPLTFEPLIETSTESMKMERDLVLFQRDPNVMLRNFKSEGKKQVLAARLSGHVKTAFPDGMPVEKDEQATSSGDYLKEGDVNVVVVADTDILTDHFWIRKQSFFGVEIPESIADNGNFVINTIENLSGNSDLISLRSREQYSRPFVVVEQIRREAEEQFRAQEQALQTKLQETEQKIAQLQQEGTGSELLLSPEQAEEIEKFRNEQLNTRKELRAVQHELQKNIESLGSWLKFINIGLIPLLIGIIAIFAGIYRVKKRSS